MHRRAAAAAIVRRRAVHATLPILGALLMTGCIAGPPDPRAEETAASAVGIEGAIVFRSVDGPLDEPGAGDVLTRGEAIRRAATTDPGLQAALSRVRISLADAGQARLLPNPVLDFVLRWGPGKPQIEVSLAQDLVGLLRMPGLASAADNRLRAAAADAVTVALDVVAEVEERYAAAQAFESLIPVIGEQRELVDRLVGIARARLDAGEGAASDVTALQAQRVELDVDEAEAKRLLREERLRLARLIGQPSGPAAWRLDEWSGGTPPIADESRWIEAGLHHRPEVQAIAWELAALGDEEALARLLPWDGAGAGADAEYDDSWSIGPSVSTPIPLFDMGGAARARVAAQQVEARHRLTLAKRLIVEEVRVALASFSASSANLHRIRSELIPLQEQRRRQAEEAYRAGLSDIAALYLAERDLRAARARAIDVERQVSVASVRLERAVGGRGIVATLADPPGAIDDSP